MLPPGRHTINAAQSDVKVSAAAIATDGQLLADSANCPQKFMPTRPRAIP